MKKFAVILIAAFLVFALTIAGCQTSTEASEATEQEATQEEAAEEEATEEAAEEPAEEEATEEAAEETEEKVWKIGFNNYADSHEFCAKVSAGIREEAEKAGVELEYAEATMDGAKMIANTQTFIDKGCDLIIDFNWVPEVGVNMVKMCDEAGIPLISMDTVYEGAYYFGADSYTAGQVLGEYLEGLIAEQWDGEIDAFVGLYYLGGGDIVKDRVVGCEDYLKDSDVVTFPSDDMNFLFDAGASDQTIKCKQQVTDFLTAHPDLDKIVFVTHNDESGAGAFAGIEASGREEDCLIGSTGGDTPFHDHIRAGGGDVWVASSAFAPEKYGEQVIPMAIDILEGKDVPEKVYLNHFVLNKDNLDEYYPE